MRNLKTREKLSSLFYSALRTPNSALPQSSLPELIAPDEAGGVAGAGVDVLDAAQEGHVVLQRRVAVAGRQEFHHAEAGDEPVQTVSFSIGNVA